MRGGIRQLGVATLAMLLTACSSPAASSAPTGPAATGAAPTFGAPTPISSLPAESLVPASEAPSEAPSPSSPPTAFQVIPPGSAITVSVKELNLRREPSTSAKRVATLHRHDLLVVSPADFVSAGFGPVVAQGYTWYPVIQIDGVDGDGQLDPLPTNPVAIGAELVSGWIATDDGTDRYVEAVAPRCPTTVDLLNVSGMLPAERLGCFGEPIVLEGTFGCGGCGGADPGRYRPAWLASPLNFDFLSIDVTQQFGPLGLRFPPDGSAKPQAGSIIRVTAHVDDHRSTRCTMQVGGAGADLVPVDAATAVLFCREQLVVDSYEVLGTDPNFTGG